MRFLAGLLLAWPLLAQIAPPAPVFSQHIQPVLQKHCVGCHNQKMATSGLRLDTPDGIQKGGLAGAVLVPGKSAESALLQRILSDKKGHQMPPAGPRMEAAEAALLKAWIDAGAKLPSGGADGATVAKAAPVKGHWAFEPIQKPNEPDIRQRDWPRNPIDRFVLARLERDNIKPSPEGGKERLLRRVSLDLTGLPPTPEEIAAFVSDNRPDAYERVVDRLLASPHYGERWARPWLDLARYADSDGYEKDLQRPWAWRYREWVIQALNRDMPYDQFTLEQLAGDLLPGATVDQKTATGFHRNTLLNREAGVSREEARFEQVINRTNTVGTVWMGLTVGCAQCHNHKYDPISHKEYYQLFAFFDKLEEKDIPAPMPGEMGPYLQSRPAYVQKRRELLEANGVSALQAVWEGKMKEAFQKPGENGEWDFSVTSFRAMFDGGDKILKGQPRTPAQDESLTNYFVASRGPDFNRDPAILQRLKDVRESLQKLEATAIPLTHAQTVVDDAEPPVTHIAQGGDYRTPGAEVQPGMLAVLPPVPAGEPVTRLTLARWLTSRNHPLTARVAANRTWQELFGRGIVRTSEDFGTQGDKPTHPELLDWLASELMNNGWSMKKLQRTIVLSATYRQDSHARPELQQRDPENALFARQSRLRLPAELIRDAALSTSGLLHSAIGGRSIKPPLPAGVAELGYGNSVKWVESTGPERYRRGLYVHYQRTTPYPQLTGFDVPDSTVSCSRRQRSNTSLQALNLLNDPVFIEAAQALALRVLREAPVSSEARVEHAFQLSLGRKPSARELSRLVQFVAQQSRSLENDRDAIQTLLPLAVEGVEPALAAAYVSMSRVLLNLDEFITRE